MYHDDNVLLSFMFYVYLHRLQQRSQQIPTGVVSKFSYLYKHALGQFEYARRIKTGPFSFVMHGFTCSLFVCGDSVLVLKVFSFLCTLLCCLIHYSDLQWDTIPKTKKRLYSCSRILELVQFF